MKHNGGKKRLAHRVMSFLLAVFMICGLFQPEIRVHAETYTCPNCGSEDYVYIDDTYYTDDAHSKRTQHFMHPQGHRVCNSCGYCSNTYSMGVTHGESHSYVISSQKGIWNPSYTENGVTYYICDQCGHVETKQDEVHSHTWDQGTITISATYTSEGVMTYTCTGCGETKTEVIPMLVCSNHAWDGGRVTREATYSATGERVYTCTNCGQARTETIPMLVCSSHSWDNGVVTTQATYHQAGVRTYTCANCGETRTETIPMLVCSTHSWDNGVVTTQATYHQAGVRTYTCTNCGETRTETIPMLVCSSHSWDNGVVTTQATYHQAGVRTYTCANCGRTRTETIPQLTCSTHSWDNGVVTTQATYHSAGVKTYTCKNCGQTRTETIPMLVCSTHSWDNGVVTTQATYHQAGVKTYTCKNCGEIRTETIPQLVCTAHVYGNALLTPAGGGVYYYISECTKCGETHSALHEHEFKWVTVKPASEEEAGIERYLCEECGYYSQEREIPRTHVQACTHPYPRNFVETVPATCCRGPIGNVVCKECGEVIAYDYVSPSRGYDPDNHTHFTESVRVEPTYKTTGVMRYTCDGCGYYYTESIPKLDCPHAHTNIKDLADGSWKVCKDCGEKLYRVSSIPSRCNHIGTVKTQVLVKAPTSTEWGEAAMVCECGRTVSTEQLHPYSEYQVTKPDGSVITVYGWFDYDAAHEIAEQTNAYRLENGLNALRYNESLQSASDTRALETIVSFSHTRPNGTRWNTTVSQWQYGGENLASGQTTVESAMNAWMNSEGHNRNLLYGLENGQTPFKGISVGVFHRYVFNSSSRPYTPNEYIYWTQQFTFY